MRLPRQFNLKYLLLIFKIYFLGKLTRHKVGCDKRFKEPKNQEPPHDWEPPAKIPKPINYASRVNPGASLLNRQHHQNTALLNQAARGALQVTILFFRACNIAVLGIFCPEIFCMKKPVETGCFNFQIFISTYKTSFQKFS